jgi:PhnB protein
MATNVKAIPEGYHTLTPDLVVKDVSRAIYFYTKAFNAQEIFRFAGEDGKVLHAEIKIGDSRLMLCAECSERRNLSPSSLNGNTGALYLYVKNVDSAFDQAVKAGCKVLQGVSDMFWGDRCGELLDLSGHRWMVATHVKEVSPAEMKKGAEAFFATMAKSK